MSATSVLDEMLKMINAERWKLLLFRSTDARVDMR